MEHVSDELYSIGRFARLCRLSAKQLRHYDELGLLRPAHVDASTGYRSYSREQIRDAMAISLLRSLDVPLPVIAEVLAGDRDAVLRAERQRLEAQLARQQRTMQTLERLLDQGLLEQDVSLVREQPCRLVTVRAVCAYADIGPTFGRCMGQLMAAIPWSPPVYGLYPVDLDEPLSIAAAMVSDAEPGPGAAVEHLPGGLTAVTTHLGPYEQLPLTYQATFTWIYERGLRPRGPVREVYLTDPNTTEPAQLATRVVVPVDEEEA